MTRLLEAEKAAREREFDDKREAKSPNENFEKTNIRFEEYKKEKMKEIELIKTVPPNLTPYYKDKVNQYFKQIP
jgi:bisphosphoglycerate-dependent phosphoglycerate mutase